MIGRKSYTRPRIRIGRSRLLLRRGGGYPLAHPLPTHTHQPLCLNVGIYCGLCVPWSQEVRVRACVEERGGGVN